MQDGPNLCSCAALLPPSWPHAARCGAGARFAHGTPRFAAPNQHAGTIIFKRGEEEKMRIDPPLLVNHDAGFGVVHECVAEPPAAPPMAPAPMQSGLTLVHDTIFEGDMIVEARRALSPPQPRASVRSQPPPQPTD